jgi:uncharacterized protein (DUF1800 family)
MSRDLWRAAIAAHRFGLGARPGEQAAFADDPRGALLAQLDGPDGLPALPSSAAIARSLVGPAGRGGPGEKKNQPQRDLYEQEATARTLHRVRSPQGFRERWVAFWSDHFTVSTHNRRVLSTAGAFEREVVRPRIKAPFSTLLRASTQHPAMLSYLDNQSSIGPRSRLGRRAAGRGLNENLAREVLELHTLGVGGGYSQDDVVSLARLITGWTVDPAPIGEAPPFRFNPAAHDPGAKLLLGRVYAQRGVLEGERALDDLARHPSTAAHVARSLAQHFVHPEAPPPVVERFARVFQDTEGDLGALAAAVVSEEMAWTTPLSRIRPPDEWLVAVGRATEMDTWMEAAPGGDDALVRALRKLGQAPWSAPSPAGWPEEGAAWSGAEAMLSRVELAERLAAKAAKHAGEATACAAAALGPLLSAKTGQAIAEVDDRQTAWLLLLASPEMMRR